MAARAILIQACLLVLFTPEGVRAADRPGI
ncbi:hypothetical protein LCGC14_1846080, partial [marine sediment metagenome]